MADPKDNAAASGGTKLAPPPAPQTPPTPPVAENRNDEGEGQADGTETHGAEGEEKTQDGE